jgi:phenylalanyl-tRNA synthetase beta chain
MLFHPDIMPVITFDFQDFSQLIKKKISKEQLIKQLPMIGADLDKVENDLISIEFFPDRPDLFCVEGIVRASRAFFDIKTGLTIYNIESSDIRISVDSSVKTIRPFIRCALVKNVMMTDELIVSLMDLQEKLHYGVGRNRKKVAIGVHNFEPIKPPFTYKAVSPQSVQFVPLAKVESMTLEDILLYHEKGITYAHLLSDFDKYPLITDNYDNVLSFPPIINGSLTEVTPFTTDLFIDVTGTNLKAVKIALNIVTTALAERGGTIYSTTIIDEGQEIRSPDLEPKNKTLSIAYVNKILGTNFGGGEVIRSLEKMGYDAKQIKKGLVDVLIPAWRSDILHEIDLIEDVAIGFGYDKFKKTLPELFTFGNHLLDQHLRDNLRTILIGLGFNEVTTFTISNERDEFEKLGMKKTNRVQLLNPITEDFTCLRTNLLPSLLKILSDNKHHNLPQQIFELGIVVNKIYKNTYDLGVVRTSAKTHFTESKALVEGILREVGITSYDISEKYHPAFIQGRCGSVKVNNQEIGFFGELHPNTILNFELEHPIIAIEISLDILKQFIK